MELLLFFALVLLLAVLVAVILLIRRPAAAPDLSCIERSLERTDRTVREELDRNRSALDSQLSAVREEMAARLAAAAHLQTTQTATMRGCLETQLSAVREEVGAALTSAAQVQTAQAAAAAERTDARIQALRNELTVVLTRQSELTDQRLESVRTTLERQVGAMREENAAKLEQMRRTVDEQLQGTLERRLGESFKQVSDRLEQVYKGLGEMQSLASEVGDVKRALTNVRTRGIWGEVGARTLLAEVLAPDQFSENVAVTGGSERVEFAIRLPGDGAAPMWLPIDAKFPLEDYLRIVDASERGCAEDVETCSQQLYVRIRECARTISSKYLAPPKTTDFAILYLPTESLYAEVLRRPGLVEELQRDYRVTVAGPTTLSAFLNSLRMGFRTLAIQKQTSEVWRVLGEVKTEFTKYSDVLAKVQKKLQEAANTVDTGLTRTRAIERRLRGVEALPEDDEPPKPLLMAAGD